MREAYRQKSLSLMILKILPLANPRTFNQTETITKAAESSAFDDDLFLFEREFKVAPGSFNITSAVTDQSSNKTIIRKVEAFIPNT